MPEKYIPPEDGQFKATEKKQITGPLSRLRESMLARVLSSTLALGAAGSALKSVDASPDAGKPVPELHKSGADSPDAGLKFNRFSGAGSDSKLQRLGIAAKEALNRAALENRMLRTQIFKGEIKKNNAGFFSGDRAKRWQERADAEQELIEHISAYDELAMKR